MENWYRPQLLWDGLITDKFNIVDCRRFLGVGVPLARKERPDWGGRAKRVSLGAEMNMGARL